MDPDQVADVLNKLEANGAAMQRVATLFQNALGHSEKIAAFVTQNESQIVDCEQAFAAGNMFSAGLKAMSLFGKLKAALA